MEYPQAGFPCIFPYLVTCGTMGGLLKIVYGTSLYHSAGEMAGTWPEPGRIHNFLSEQHLLLFCCNLSKKAVVKKGMEKTAEKARRNWKVWESTNTLCESRKNNYFTLVPKPDRTSCLEATLDFSTAFRIRSKYVFYNYAEMHCFQNLSFLVPPIFLQRQ